MNLKKALARKKNRQTYKHVGLIMPVYIAPKRDKDYQLFLLDFINEEDKVELAKGHSINQEYRLCAIWEGEGFLKDIPNIDEV
jgi:hypothetical protein